MVSPVEALCGQITVWRMRGREEGGGRGFREGGDK